MAVSARAVSSTRIRGTSWCPVPSSQLIVPASGPEKPSPRRPAPRATNRWPRDRPRAARTDHRAQRTGVDRQPRAWNRRVRRQQVTAVVSASSDRVSSHQRFYPIVPPKGRRADNPRPRRPGRRRDPTTVHYDCPVTSTSPSPIRLLVLFGGPVRRARCVLHDRGPRAGRRRSDSLPRSRPSGSPGPASS